LRSRSAGGIRIQSYASRASVRPAWINAAYISFEHGALTVRDHLGAPALLAKQPLERIDNRYEDHGDAHTIWLFREKLTTAGAIKRLFEQFDAMLR
jgi:hypothetical protein